MCLDLRLNLFIKKSLVVSFQLKLGLEASLWLLILFVVLPRLIILLLEGIENGFVFGQICELQFKCLPVFLQEVLPILVRDGNRLEIGIALGGLRYQWSFLWMDCTADAFSKGRACYQRPLQIGIINTLQSRWASQQVHSLRQMHLGPRINTECCLCGWYSRLSLLYGTTSCYCLIMLPITVSIKLRWRCVNLIDFLLLYIHSSLNSYNIWFLNNWCKN